MFTRFITILFVLFSLVSCKDKKGSAAITKPGMNEMADLNKFLVSKDRERIRNYIERKNLKMNESPTGLWYQIINEGEGKKFIDNDKIVMDYECSLLDGTKCYSSSELGPKKIVLGRT